MQKWQHKRRTAKRTGIISVEARREFMARPRDDFSSWLTFDHKKLDGMMVDRLKLKPPIWHKLETHQKVFVLIGAILKRFGFFSDTGTGKTLTSIALMHYFVETDHARSFLVLVPNKSNKDEWADEFDKHAPDFPYKILRGSTEEKWHALTTSNANTFVETYGGFLHLVCDTKRVKRKNKSGKVVEGKPEMVINERKVRDLAKRCEGVFADESTFLKNQAGLPYMIARRLAKVARCFYVLTGTPFGRDVHDLWAQVRLVDDGYTLGETLGMFRAAFFDTKEEFFGNQTHKLKEGAAETINKFLNHSTITLPADLSKMPRLDPQKRYCEMREDAETYYNRARDIIMSARGDRFAMKSAFTRMRQISSGFIGFKDDETGDRAEFEFPIKPKMDLLEELIDKIGPRHKIIIFHEYNYTAKMIGDMLAKNKIGHRFINGTIKSDRIITAAKADFKTDPKVRALVLANSAGGFGLNLQVARYGLFYESPVSPIIRKQTERRFHRQWSEHDFVGLFDLVMKHSADETILQFHKEGRDLMADVLNVHDPRDAKRLRL